MAKMPDHINVTVGYVAPSSTSVPCNHTFPYWSVIPPTHCPVCGACLAPPPPPPPPCPYHPPVYPWWPAPPQPYRITVTCADTC